jgi:hypothetical protein
MSYAPWITKTEKPYGFRVTIERSLGRGVVRHTFLSKTSDIAKATQAARYKTGFLRVISREPLNRAQFAEAFPPSVAKSVPSVPSVLS